MRGGGARRDFGDRQGAVTVGFAFGDGDAGDAGERLGESLGSAR